MQTKSNADDLVEAHNLARQSRSVLFNNSELEPTKKRRHVENRRPREYVENYIFSQSICSV